MIDYGKVRSTVKPQPIEIDDFSVWRHTDIREISENIGTDNEFVGYEYNSTRYDKNEYILQQQNDINDIMAALCELAELCVGGE